MEKKPSPIRLILYVGVFILTVRFIHVITTDGGFFSSNSPETVYIAAGRITAISASGDATSSSNPTWRSKEWRKSVDFYSSIFQALVAENFLSFPSRSLCIGTIEGPEVLALKEAGVENVIGVSKKSSPPLVIAGDGFSLNFANNTFDFVFFNKIEKSNLPLVHASEITRILKVEGFLVIMTESAGDSYSSRSLHELFPSFRKVRSREIDESDKEIIFQKLEARIEETGSNGNSLNKCSVPEHKIQLIQSAEPIIKEEPLKPWLALKRNVKNIKYLPSVVNISFKRRYIYIDVGARSYGWSIGSWFKKQYPKQNRTFEIYAIEADKAFHHEYLTKKGVNLLPFAAWVRNESLSFEVNHENEKGGKGMGRLRASGSSWDGRSSEDLHTIQGFDLAEWLRATVTERDFVVMKMDVEGTEFDLIPRLFETGGICLIDELFLECHYNRWQRCCPGERSSKYEHTYSQCFDLFSSLRDNGVLVHQWW